MRIVFLWIVVLGLASPAMARPVTTEVDLALVLAVDVSFSTSSGSGARQREGYANALRSTAVHRAIQSGALGRIAIAYVEWAGAYDQRLVVRWTLVDGPATAEAFAARIAGRGLRSGGRTSLSGAIDYAVQLLDEAPFMSVRQVLDLSADGSNNHGRPVTAARDAAVARGITINGLPVMLGQPGSTDGELDVYFEQCVIGGPGAFVLPVREADQFARAIELKLVREIAAIPGTHIHPANAPSPRC